MLSKQIKLTRYTGLGDLSRETWKDLIAALVLAGYEVYGDEENIIFDLGDGDEVKDV